MRFTVCMLLHLLFVIQMQAQIFSNPITGTNPNTANPYTAGQTVNPNITVSGIGRGSGITGNNANNRYNARSWSLFFDANGYFEFTLTPNSGFLIDFTSFVYTGQVSLFGPIAFAFRSSIDGFASDIGTPTGTGATISLTAPAYQTRTSATTFRLYAYGTVVSAATFSVDDFAFNGTVSPLVILPLQDILLEVQNGTVRNSAVLNWHTQQEANIKYFSIEYSTTGKAGTFDSVANVPFNRSIKNYTTTIACPPNTTLNYFRLKMVNESGGYTYSAIKTLKSKAQLFNVALYPNPASSNVQLSWNAEKANTVARIIITDENGKNVSIFSKNTIKGYNTMSFAISQLRKGIHFVKINCEEQTETQMLLIK